MRKLSLIIVASVMAACAHAGSQVTFTAATGTNTNVTAYADSFTGEIDEIAVYSTVATGTVSIAALDPYSGTALVLATNAECQTYLAWAPRVSAATGEVARAVTYVLNASNELFNAQGESIRAVFNSSRTGVTYRVRLKLK